MEHMWKIILVIVFIISGVWIYSWYTGKVAPSVADSEAIKGGEAVAYFAGGCFWCVESDYEKLPGVLDAVSGYMGGNISSPSYNQVSGGSSGHRETVKVVYDPSEVSYRRLVLDLLKHTDPTDVGGSFYDRGHQYTSAVYYQTEEEKRTAEEVIAELETREVFDKPIATRVEEVGTFWVAEEYHQNYYKKNPLPYQRYRNASGRDVFIESVWGDGAHDDLFEDTSVVEMSPGAHTWENFQKPDDAMLKEALTPLQYYVTQEEGTETPFENEYWDNHEEGIYVDVVSGEPLFSSTDKYDSGTGWPSFLKPIDYDFVTEHKDYKLIIPRTEIRSKYADSHLGHIILDGPIENNKIRYCMNSAALRFVPKEDLKQEGLGEYLYFFN